MHSHPISWSSFDGTVYSIYHGPGIATPPPPTAGTAGTDVVVQHMKEGLLSMVRNEDKQGDSR